MPDPFDKEFKEAVARLGNRALNQIFNVDSKHQCEACNTPSHQWERFCIQCGTKNPNFLLEELKREFGFETIEEAAEKDCPEWHTIEPEIVKYKFCPHCGLNIFAQTLNSLAE